MPRPEGSFPLPGSTSSYQQGNPAAHSSPRAEPAPGRAGCSTQRCHHPGAPPPRAGDRSRGGRRSRGHSPRCRKASHAPPHLPKRLPAPPQALTAPVGADTGVPIPWPAPAECPSCQTGDLTTSPASPEQGCCTWGTLSSASPSAGGFFPELNNKQGAASDFPYAAVPY